MACRNRPLAEVGDLRRGTRDPDIDGVSHRISGSDDEFDLLDQVKTVSIINLWRQFTVRGRVAAIHLSGSHRSI